MRANNSVLKVLFLVLPTTAPHSQYGKIYVEAFIRAGMSVLHSLFRSRKVRREGGGRRGEGVEKKGGGGRGSGGIH